MIQIRDWLPFLGMPLMLLAVQIIAIILVTPMQVAGLVAFENPESVANPLIFIGILLVFTLVLLALIRVRRRRFIAFLIGFAIFMTFLYIFGALFHLMLGTSGAVAAGTVIAAGAATALLYLYPEWYVIDILGVLISAGIASIFGVSHAILPVIVLLVLLAVYDAISVYRTKHMITLAEGVLETKAPIMVVVPKRMDYSFRKEGLEIKEGEERGAFVMGMGDLIMPSILVASSHVFVDAPAVLWTLSAPTLGAMAGSLVGLAVLLYFVNKGNPQAGLPPLNGGAIAGFLIGAVLAGSLAGVLSVSEQQVKHRPHPLPAERGHRWITLDPLEICLVSDRHHRDIDEPAYLVLEPDLVIERVATVFTCVQNEEYNVGCVDDSAHRLPLDGVTFICRALEDARSIDELDSFAFPDVAVANDDPFGGEGIGCDLGFCRGDEPDK